MKGYRPNLDVLRAGAVMSVLYFHMWDPATPIGALGVKLFFVISGFLISSMLLQVRATSARSNQAVLIGLRNFYIRRALRLWPAYFGLLLVLLVANYHSISHVITWHALFLSNILFSLRNEYVPWTTAALWSLSVEEQFYLIWPAIMLGVPQRILLLIVGLLIVAGLVWAMYVVPSAPTALWVYHLPPAALAPLGTGAALALIYDKGVCAPKLVEQTGWLGGVALVAISANGWAIWGYEFLILLLMIWLVVWGLADQTGKPSYWQPILATGRISYGIYLYHLPVMALLKSSGIPALADRGPAMFWAGAVISIGAAIISWKMIEQPFNRMKTAFPYGKRGKE